MNNLQKALAATKNPLTIPVIKENDKVTFAKDRQKITHTVTERYLDNEESKNDVIFNELGITGEEKHELSEKAYGRSADGLWPEYDNYAEGTRFLCLIINIAKSQGWQVTINANPV